MAFAVYGGRTERAVNALLAQRAAEQRAIEEASRQQREHEDNLRMESERIKMARQRRAWQEEKKKLLDQLAEAKIEAAENRWIMGVPRPLLTKRIITLAARRYGVGVRDIRSPSRKENIVMARQCAMYWLRRFTGLSLPQIAKAVGRTDHTTAYFGIKAYRRKRAAQGINLREVK